MKKKIQFIILTIGTILASLCLNSCQEDLPTPDEKLKDNTVIVYMGADNNLNSYSKSDLNEMTRAIDLIPADCQVIVFTDDLSSTSQIHLLRREESTIWKKNTTEVNSANPSVMKSILQDIVNNFPSEKYSLVLWSHGSGWANHTRSIIVDENCNSSTTRSQWIQIPELAGILSALPKMEYIFFDACFMQSVETASYLYPYTNYIIGSPVEIPGNGAPYGIIMNALCKADPQKIIDGYASGYPEKDEHGKLKDTGVLLSAVNTAEFLAFCKETQKHIPSIFQKGQMPSNAGIQIYAPQYGTGTYEHTAFPVPYDIRSVMHKYLNTEDYKKWEEQWRKTILYPVKWNKWDTVYEGLFHYILTDPEYYGGISMNIPSIKYNTRGWNEEFAETPWYRLAGWNQTGW